MKTINLNVDVHHLTRVEGHGNIHVRVENGELREARWDVVETPRFFEVMLQGKHYTSAGILTARICGICSIGHCLASVRATEHAFGVEIPESAARLRLLAKHGETLQSHALHLFFLAAPDFLGLPSVVPLIQSNPDLVGVAARLKGLGNRIASVVAGRAVHPITIQVGGMSKCPQVRDLMDLRDSIELALPDLATSVALFKSLKMPQFERQTEFVALEGVDSYPFIGGALISTDGVRREEHQYLEMTNEYVVEESTSKWCRLSRESMAVGALARFNLNAGNLHPEARKVAKELGLEPICHNPFMNNIAQLVECVHVAHDAVRIIDALLEDDDSSILAEVRPRAGEGVGAVEVPRGILYHHYVYDEGGRIVKANCVIPTTQNNANIHHDLGAFVRENSGPDMSDGKLELLCSMLVRAYDPCISCSVH